MKWLGLLMKLQDWMKMKAFYINPKGDTNVCFLLKSNFIITRLIFKWVNKYEPMTL